MNKRHLPTARNAGGKQRADYSNPFLACQSVFKAFMTSASCKIKCDTESLSPKVSIGAQTALAGWGDRGKDDSESFPLVEAMK